MALYVHITLLVLSLIPPGQVTDPCDVSEVLRRFAASRDAVKSWVIRCQLETRTAPHSNEPERIRTNACDLRSDGQRALSRYYRESRLPPFKGPAVPDDVNYVSMLWDGTRYINSRKNSGQATGRFTIISHPRDSDIEALRRGGRASVLLGFCEGDIERIDRIAQKADRVSLGKERELVNGIPCFAVHIESPCGDYAIWIDPNHAYSIAKACVRREQARGHSLYGRPMQAKAWIWAIENIRFAEISGVWMGVDADCRLQVTPDTGESYTIAEHLQIIDFLPDPDHEALRSFVPDIQDGAEGWIYPTIVITYVWEYGAPVPKFDRADIALIDETIGSMINLHAGGAASTPERARSGLMVSEKGAWAKEQTAAEARNASAEGGLQSSTGERAEKDQSRVPHASGSPDRSLKRPFCGLYCAYAFLKLSGQDIHLQELVKPEYVGSIRGSSMGELKKAIMDYGAYASPAKKMTTRILRYSRYPVILHTKAIPEAKDYDHYQLFLGTENGKAKLFNPPEPPVQISFGELAALWDGFGLIVSTTPIDVSMMFNQEVISTAGWVSVGFIVVLVTYGCRWRLSKILDELGVEWRMLLTVAQGLLLVTAALLCGLLIHFINDEQGLLANAKAAASVQKAYAAGFIPKISAGAVRRILNADAVLIDARLPQDFEAGHIKKAIHIPVDANDSQVTHAIEGIPADAPTIVYCQSAGCRFADQIAVRLLQRGFSNVLIFRGGWREWMDRGYTTDTEQPAVQKRVKDGANEPNTAGR